MNGLRQFDYLKSVNADSIDEIYSRYLQDPESVDSSWRYFFDGIYLGEATAITSQDGGVAPVGEGEEHSVAASADRAGRWTEELKVLRLIDAYREHGHRAANVNPLFPVKNPSEGAIKELTLVAVGLAESQLNEVFFAAQFLGAGSGAPQQMTLQQIIDQLRKTYCGTVGVELVQIQNGEERAWVQQKIEAIQGNYAVSVQDKKFILSRLTESETLERFIHTRYVAQKRFSIEGGEGLIPALDAVIESAARLGAEEIVMGMAHRGRLNVLVNTFGKKPEYLFTEFDDNYRLSTDHGEGDVKYHKGHSKDQITRDGKAVHLSMGFNPSHLEFINPVVVGIAKAKQYQRKDFEKNKVCPVLIHGDSAFSGQGVVYETLQASQLEAYGVGGAIHIVSNNQVGFTTDPKDTRSSRYCTDLAKFLEVPIFHVNGDDPEAIWMILQLATEYRYRFHKDVFIDLVCYRKYGHNEGDEPSFTQPTLYKVIASHPNPREFYARRLASENVVSSEESAKMAQEVTDRLQKALDLVREQKPEPFYSEYEKGAWSKYHHAHDEDLFKPVNTTVSANQLIELTQKINRFPEGFKIHSKLERMFDARIQTVQQGHGIDWGNAEVLAYASLVAEGTTVRMSGQDVRRGTFTHRHATVFDFNTNAPYTAINALHPQGKFLIYNSHLSETAALGFEYGWALTDPDSLTVWEAQFGDFANGAQVMIDQFISTSESKWHRAHGLTLLLPHGFEGQGPEHSSARLERFLQLCGRYNMTVAYPSTPAQIFHLLRRQVKREFRKPLVVMTPKSLLRHPKAVSALTDFSEDGFKEVIDDLSFVGQPQAMNDVTRLMICTGKIFYDLSEENEARKKANKATKTALIRIEQLYPWPEHQLAKIVERYRNAREVFFVQEEPRNMGAWMHFQGMWSGALSHFGARFPKLGLTYVGREICASPAVGSKKLHDQEQKEIILKAFQE